MPESNVIDALIDAVHGAEEMMDHGRGLVARGAEWRTESLALLRKTLSVADIAARLKVTPSAIYSALNEAEPPPMTWLPPADKRIAQVEESGAWTFFCPSHAPGRPVIMEFRTQVEAEQFAASHDKAVHGIGLS